MHLYYLTILDDSINHRANPKTFFATTRTTDLVTKTPSNYIFNEDLVLLQIRFIFLYVLTIDFLSSLAHLYR